MALSSSLVLIAVLPGVARAVVLAYPSPGDRVASPQTQIAFRQIAFGELPSAAVTVTGSKSGVHTGSWAKDSDGRGGSFLPGKPFTAGETVTVKTSFPVLGAKGGSFHFTVANPAGAIPYTNTAKAPRVPGDVWQFHSQPGLEPTAVKIGKAAGPTAQGDIFLAPQSGPDQYGPEIIDPNGNLVWSQPVPANDETTDFGVQTYDGQRVLTWWQGNVNAGCGRGTDVIYNSSYQQIGTVRAANGQDADLHEFTITPSNTALITACYPVYWNASAVHGSSREIVIDSIVQEIDIKTGLVLYQWDSLDHVPLTATYENLPPKNTRDPFDYFHLNSVNLDKDGNLIISARNTRAAYKIGNQTGGVMWTLGGKQSSFRLGPGAAFAYQHDASIVSNHDWYLIVFDDGGGPPVVHQSRGLKLFLDVAHKKAWKVAQYTVSPAQQTYVEGNVQQLPDMHMFIGWGSSPFFSESAANGKQLLTGRFVDENESYRAYRYTWSGTPQQPPSVAASPSGSHTNVYASWNGATAVTSWRVLGGGSPNSLTTVATATRRGFETEITAGTESYVAVQALGAGGKVLGQSATVAPH